ncbi:hypothetical protein R1flu_009849 [Riccia fluitans]|uniref:Uncharacterized protein n=1 Tax=Riccia fluitans TaxID=41844 RepID=A0ABD1Z699_9MARC
MHVPLSVITTLLRTGHSSNNDLNVPELQRVGCSKRAPRPSCNESEGQRFARLMPLERTIARVRRQQREVYSTQPPVEPGSRVPEEKGMVAPGM